MKMKKITNFQEMEILALKGTRQTVALAAAGSEEALLWNPPGKKESSTRIW